MIPSILPTRISAPFLFTILIFVSAALADTSNVSTVVLRTCGQSVVDEAGSIMEDIVLADDEFEHFRTTLEIFDQAGFSDLQCLDYLKLAVELGAAGISLQDLASKVREGVAKEASPDRISRVIQDRVGRLKNARVAVLSLESEGVAFLDKQIAYKVMADYLSRGVGADEITRKVLDGELSDYPALGNVIR